MEDRTRHPLMMYVRQFRQPAGERTDYSRQPRPFHIIAHVLKGGASFAENSVCFTVQEGDTLFIPMHSCYRSEWSAPEASEVLSCFFVLPDHALPAGRKFLLQKADVPDAGESIRRIASMQGQKEGYLGMLAEFYGMCSSVFASLKYEDGTVPSQRIGKAVDYIRAHYAEHIPVALLAEQAQMSESHFYSCFQREVGLSPIAYKHRLAVIAAEQLLAADATLSVERISELTGFESSTYFRRVFRALTGCSPREYRRMTGL